MEKTNYSQIYAKLTKGLSPKIKDIFNRRFGISSGNAETLESIGKSLGITRERVRQIEEAGFTYIRKNNKEALENAFKNFHVYFADKGGFKKEEIALEDLGGKKQQPYVAFLLTMGDQFFRVCGKKDYHYFWAAMPETEKKTKETLASLVADIKSHGKLVTKQELLSGFAPKYNLNEASLTSYLEVSKKIQENKEGKIGLIDWPEIKPRGVKDKAFLVFKKHQKPLHFRQITGLIDELDFNAQNKKTHAQTVHNELIKDARFVLVGRGTYALSEWGYVPGTIREVITNVLNDKKLTNQEEIVKEVLSQRLVAKNTVLINLNNKKYFNKGPDGKYFIRQEA
ncbi:MAG: hypothetical protein A3F47_00065 [Candidatus Staskawiczbacteria bacterium RIFCSPHIGHO2_12_FULL_38_11]|uniref:HTH HARE-type domain-containing protein n=1 Tax=Candidatus Staskawiczbacteria bacterium RIFCSPHIGHO2_12_FULL_38_11 TaxID=1802209 RepID=A0A1G2I9R4_9BACT|nr:MAG: hypothetical protein A3F47_00065 [Candidatus Staskawiczbacteria bacterium RIFCSPHIGHO2_12_FULL_38_11]